MYDRKNNTYRWYRHEEGKNSISHNNVKAIYYLSLIHIFVLAIAIVVDDAIVVVEGVHAKLDQGYTSARLASIDAMNELGGAIVSITLVMMAVFVPVSFMGGSPTQRQARWQFGPQAKIRCPIPH